MQSTFSELSDYHRAAQQRLEPAIWDYLADGDNSDSNSNETNENAFTAVRLTPRPLRDVRHGHTRLNLFGQSLEHPIILAPIAYQRLFHPHGESACAMAASAQGGLSIISSLASQSFDTIVQASSAGGSFIPWFQLYWQADRPRTLRLLQRAIAAGCSAVVLTVDAPIKRATLQLPSHVSAINLEVLEDAESLARKTVFSGWMAEAPTWDDLAWLRQQTTLPLLVKGILHPDDAAQAVDAGCDGIIVSNHGGRVLHGTPSSLDALKTITERVQNRVPVLLDSGIRNGRDVFVALAAGATAVLLGRPTMWGLAGNGAMGVAHVIRLLRDELEMTMALMGCAQLADIRTLGMNSSVA